MCSLLKPSWAEVKTHLLRQCRVSAPCRLVKERRSGFSAARSPSAGCFGALVMKPPLQRAAFGRFTNSDEFSLNELMHRGVSYSHPGGQNHAALKFYWGTAIGCARHGSTFKDVFCLWSRCLCFYFVVNTVFFIKREAIPRVLDFSRRDEALVTQTKALPIIGYIKAA
uniref:Uncharacterized protein TCIL3000_10_1510 n=1 Tax=Trypanosoma congolense (strain IL3000) TaxID=1068625 RepID=G0UVH7_TRYCI|nr:unnamed protein product [Trypanosoma congolense IL3000]